MGSQVYLFRFTFHGVKYLFTNANYDITTLTSTDYSISPSDVFTSINIFITSSFILDSGFADSPLTIESDFVPPFSLITELDAPIQAEVFEVFNDEIIGKFKGIVGRQKRKAQTDLTVNGQKIKFKNKLPVLTIGQTCPFQVYGPHCAASTTLHNQVIIPVSTEDRFVMFNISNYAAWTTRQQVLGTTQGFAYENGYIEQNNCYITVEQQLLNNYNVYTSTHGTTIIRVRTRDPFSKDQKVELYQGLLFRSYSPITNVGDDGTYKYLTIAVSSGTYNNINVHYFRTKFTARFDELYPNTTYPTYVVEGCNRSLDHCRNKFNNESRFLGFVNMPDRNPVTTKLKN